jgi:hypothetical protein
LAEQEAKKQALGSKLNSIADKLSKYNAGGGNVDVASNDNRLSDAAQSIESSKQNIVDNNSNNNANKNKKNKNKKNNNNNNNDRNAPQTKNGEKLNLVTKDYCQPDCLIGKGNCVIQNTIVIICFKIYLCV